MQGESTDKNQSMFNTKMRIRVRRKITDIVLREMTICYCVTSPFPGDLMDRALPDLPSYAERLEVCGRLVQTLFLSHVTHRIQPWVCHWCIKNVIYDVTNWHDTVRWRHMGIYPKSILTVNESLWASSRSSSSSLVYDYRVWGAYSKITCKRFHSENY